MPTWKSAAVRDQIKHGADWNASPGEKSRLPCRRGEGQRNAIVAGSDTIEHGFGLDQDQANMMAARGLCYDATVVRYTEPGIDDADERNTGGKFRIIPVFEKAAAVTAPTKGGKVMMGSGVDGSTFAHGTQGLEFEALVKIAGLTPARALQSGTVINAEVLGWSDQPGSIRASTPAWLQYQAILFRTSRNFSESNSY